MTLLVYFIHIISTQPITFHNRIRNNIIILKYSKAYVLPKPSKQMVFSESNSFDTKQRIQKQFIWFLFYFIIIFFFANVNALQSIFILFISISLSSRLSHCVYECCYNVIQFLFENNKVLHMTASIHVYTNSVIFSVCVYIIFIIFRCLRFSFKTKSKQKNHE